MLTIVNSLSIEGYTVYQDDQNDLDFTSQRIDALMANDQAHFQSLEDALNGATSSAPNRPKITAPDAPPPSCRFYVLPDKPGIAMDQNGQPIFSLIVYRIDEDTLDPTSKGDVGGGILTFTVEMAVPDAKLTRIKQKLTALVYGNDNSGDGSQKQVIVTPVSFLDGTVSVAVAGEGTGDTSDPHFFVKNAVGTGDISGVADNRKAVMVSLTQAGASLMSQLQKLHTLPILVQYNLEFENRLLGVTMRVWCDINSSYHLIQSTHHEIDDSNTGYLGLNENSTPLDKVTAATEIMMKNSTAGVTVTPLSSSIDNDTILALQKFGEDMLTKQMQSVVDAKGLPPDLDRTWIDQYSSDSLNTFNFTLDQRMVLKQKYSPSANVSNVFAPPANFDQFVTFIDLTNPFFKQLRVPVRVNADFTKLPVSHVVVTLEYRSRTADGTYNDAVKSFDFTDGSTVQTFDVYANTLDALSYNWKAEVHYKDSQQSFITQHKNVKDRFLVVDVGTMGLIDVDIGTGLVDMSSFPKADVSVQYTSRATGNVASKQFLLDKDNTEAEWTEVILEESSGAYQYKVDWMRSDGTILTGQWQDSSSRQLRLDSPVGQKLSISVIASGNFKDASLGEPLSAIAVALHYADPDNNYTQDGSLTFVADGTVQPWEIWLRNVALQDYQYRYTLIYKGGVQKKYPADGSWYPGQPGFVTVGEKFDLEVSLYPYLLHYADKDSVVQVDMLYTSADGKVKSTGSFVFNRDNAKTVVWRANTGGLGPQPYSVTVTYFSSAGVPTVMPAETHDSSAYVIPAAH